MGKICPKCGKELRETARFCTSCGTKLEEGMPENPVNTVNVQNGSINTVMPKQEKKWYQKTGWIIALLIVFFPVGLYLMWKYTDWKKGLKIAVSIVCAVCLVIGLFSISSQDGNEISLSSFVESYNEISQNKFAENGMSEWQPISMDEMLKDDTPMPLFKEDVIRYIYVYPYQSVGGTEEILGEIIIDVDMNGMVVGVEFGMSTKYLFDGDDFQNVVLDSLIQTFAPTLSENDIDEIRSILSIERETPLMVAAENGVAGRYEYEGMSYYVTSTDILLNFGMFSSDKLDI